MLLREFVAQLREADDMYVQSFQHDPSRSDEIAGIRRTMKVFEKIIDHPGSLIEVADDADFEKAFRKQADEIASAGCQKGEIDTFVTSFAKADDTAKVGQTAAE